MLYNIFCEKYVDIEVLVHILSTEILKLWVLDHILSAEIDDLWVFDQIFSAKFEMMILKGGGGQLISRIWGVRPWDFEWDGGLWFSSIMKDGLLII